MRYAVAGLLGASEVVSANTGEMTTLFQVGLDGGLSKLLESMFRIEGTENGYRLNFIQIIISI